MNERDERVARARRRARCGVPELAQPPVDDHADAVGERGRVLEVVGDEQRRQRELAQQLAAARRARRAFVCASSAESGSSSSSTPRVARERARERDPLALAAGELAPAARVGEVGDAEALEVARRRARLPP